VWATCLMAALALGPVIAGVILEHFAWRWLYLLPIPVSLLGLLFSIKLLTDSRAPGTRRLDWPGQLTAAPAITALVYGIIEAGVGSFTDAKVMLALSTAVVASVAFVVVERRSPSPMLDLTLFPQPFVHRHRTDRHDELPRADRVFLRPQPLLRHGPAPQHPRSRLAAAGGVPGAAGPLGVPMGRLVHRVSPRALIPGGLLVVAVALLSLITIDAGTSFGSLAWRLALLGLGVSFVMTPMTATAVSSVPFHQAGMAAAANNACRQLGAALGPAVLGSLLSARAVHALPGHLTDAGLGGATVRRVTEAADAGGLRTVGALRLGADTPRVLGALSQAFIDGLHLCLVVAAVLTLLAAAMGFVLLRRAQAAAPPERRPGTDVPPDVPVRLRSR
jgi:MFS family permease